MKKKRHKKIYEIIEKESIGTQEELAETLKQEGFNVTQATVSRDIKDLRLIKVLTSEGTSRYTGFTASDLNISGKLLSIFSESFVSADSAANIVVVKTLPGMAQASAAAIDSLKWTEILGTIAGDDTIMIVCRDIAKADDVVSRFNDLAVI